MVPVELKRMEPNALGRQRKATVWGRPIDFPTPSRGLLARLQVRNLELRKFVAVSALLSVWSNRFKKGKLGSSANRVFNYYSSRTGVKIVRSLIKA